MNKYLYTLLALVMVNLHAEELSSIPIGPLSDEFSVPLNADGEKVARALLRKPSPNMDAFLYPSFHKDAFFCPYVGLSLIGFNTGVTFRNKSSKVELDARVNLPFPFATISASKMFIVGDKKKMGPKRYRGVGFGVSVNPFPNARFDLIIFPRFFYGIERPDGFDDFGLSLMIDPISLFILPIPELRCGFRF